MCAQPDASRILRLVEEINDSAFDARIEDQVRRYYEDQWPSDETRTTLKAMLLRCAYGGSVDVDPRFTRTR